MKKLIKISILVAKGILLWVTTIITLLFVSGIDSIAENGYIKEGLAIVLILIYTCYRTLSLEEVGLLSGTTLLEKWTGTKFDN